MNLEALTRKARYGHRQYLYWYDRDGLLQWAYYSRQNIKAAILSVGCRGRFYWLDGSGCTHVARTFRMMIHLWRCAPSLELSP